MSCCSLVTDTDSGPSIAWEVTIPRTTTFAGLGERRVRYRSGHTPGRGNPRRNQVGLVRHRVEYTHPWLGVRGVRSVRTSGGLLFSVRMGLPLVSFPRFVRGRLQKDSNHRARMQSITPVRMGSFNDLGTPQDQLIFPYKEEVGGSTPSTPTENAFDYWDFSVSGSELIHFGPHLVRARSSWRSSTLRSSVLFPHQRRGRPFEPSMSTAKEGRSSNLLVRTLSRSVS